MNSVPDLPSDGVDRKGRVVGHGVVHDGVVADIAVYCTHAADVGAGLSLAHAERVGGALETGVLVVDVGHDHVDRGRGVLSTSVFGANGLKSRISGLVIR
jgi:hypothetical protein